MRRGDAEEKLHAFRSLDLMEVTGQFHASAAYSVENLPSVSTLGPRSGLGFLGTETPCTCQESNPVALVTLLP
jgi:hypothetical protein